jgi:hypothetical protein
MKFTGEFNSCASEAYRKNMDRNKKKNQILVS